MADMPAALLQRTRADAAVAAIAGARVYLSIAPQGASMPYLILRLQGGDREATLKGFSGRRERPLQLDGYAPQHLTASQLVEVAVQALAPVATVAGVRFNHAEAGEPFDLPEEIGGVLVPRVSCSMTMHYTLED